jgi:hypothetical protein
MLRELTWLAARLVGVVAGWAANPSCAQGRSVVRVSGVLLRSTPGCRATALAACAVVLLASPGASEQAGTATEETPFRVHGKIYDSPDTHPNLREKYGDILFQYPNAAACITGDPGNDGDLIDADLRWHELMSAEEVEVCLFRVFSRLGSLERIEEWLTRQGWERPFRHSSTSVLSLTLPTCSL